MTGRASWTSRLKVGTAYYSGISIFLKKKIIYLDLKQKKSMSFNVLLSLYNFFYKQLFEVPLYYLVVQISGRKMMIPKSVCVHSSWKEEGTNLSLRKRKEGEEGGGGNE